MTSYSERRLRRMVDEWWTNDGHLEGRGKTEKFFQALSWSFLEQKLKPLVVILITYVDPLVNACLI